MSNFIDFGIFFENTIKFIASFLASDGFAGIVCIGLLITLVLLSIIYYTIQNSSLSVINAAIKIVRKIPSEEDFASDIKSRKELNSFVNAPANTFSHSFGRAWEEYYETMESPDEEGQVFRNTLRPSYFFNSEDLGQTNPIWKQIPSVFVSVGLLLTFLGIISAIGGLIETTPKNILVTYKNDKKLVYIKEESGTKYFAFKRSEGSKEFYILKPKKNRANPSFPIEFEQNNDQKAESSENWVEYKVELPSFDDQGMALFLNSAKSKFLMSLTGLFCSILFMILVRLSATRVDKSLRSFCDNVERLVTFQTAESIASSQLTAIEQQTKQLDALGNNLAGTIGNALTNDLPKALSEKLDPVINQVMNSSSSSVDTMVKGLGDSLHEKLNESLDEIATTLSGVNTTLESVSRNLSSSGNNVATEMNKAISDLSAGIEKIRKNLEKDAEEGAKRRDAESDKSQKALSSVLKKIEENTREGAEKMESAAKAIEKAADNLKENIEKTGEASAKDMQKMLAKVNENARDDLDTAGTKITEGIKAASSSILEEASTFQDGLKGIVTGPIEQLEKALNSFNQQIKDSTEQLETYGNVVSSASKDTDTASRALAGSAESLRGASQPILDSISAMKTINLAISDSLKTTSKAVTQSQEVVVTTLEALKKAIDEFDKIIDKSSTIDQNLGKAFRDIKMGLETSQSELRNLVTDSTNKMANAVNALRSAVDDINDYKS